ncbi:MAG TPA: hypothetical protein VNM90_22525 [Haliangium sp.]|nr:hypothetical protein [Haliangium sp.]
MTKYTGFEVAFRSMSIDTAARLQVSSLFTADSDRNGMALMFDIILHTDYHEQVDLAGGFSYIKKKGTGLRIAMKGTGLDLEASLTFASVAAQATLKKATAEYKIHGFGLSDEVVASLLTIPMSGGLSSDTYHALQRTISVQLPAYLRSNDVGVSEYVVPVPSFQDEPGARARSINYAASMVAQRKSLVDANKHRPQGISTEIVALVYARFLGSVSTDSDKQPSPEQAARANRWLATGNIH